MPDWLHDLLALNVDLISKGGYAGVFLLMAVESSFIPFPSEVVVPPAGYLAFRGEMSLPAVIAAATGGSLAGALFNYWFAVRVGRPFFLRYGRWFLVGAAQLDRAETFFRRHGEIGTFVGRLIPVVRQLISLPAGMARMNLLRFSLYTTLGAGIYCTILGIIGWSLGKAGERLDLLEVKRETLDLFLHWILPALALLVVGYVLLRRRRRAGAPGAPGTPGAPGGPA